MESKFLTAALAAVLASCAGGPETRPDAAPATQLPTTSDPERVLAEATKLVGANDFARAEVELTRIAAAMPGDPRPLTARAQARFGLGKLDEAISDVGAAIALKDSSEARALRGRYLGTARRFDEAARDLEQAVALDPANGNAWVILSAVQLNRGDDVESAWAFAQAVSPLGRAQAVDRLWTSLLSLAPDPVQPQESLDRCSRGRAAAMEGQYVEAQREYRNALKYSPRYHWCIANLAEVTFALGDAASAEKMLRQAIAGYPPRLDGLRADAKGRLAALLLVTGKDAAEAVRLARETVAARGEQAAVLEVLARSCDATGDLACSRDAWQRLLARPHVSDRTRVAAEGRLAALRVAPGNSTPGAPAPGTAASK